MPVPAHTKVSRGDGHLRRRIVDVVLGVHRRGPHRGAVLVACAGVGASALLGLWTLLAGPRPAWRPDAIARGLVELSLDEDARPVERRERPPHSAARVPSPSPSPSPPSASPRRRLEPRTERRSHGPSASAAPIVASEPDAPVDLTGEAIVVGEARAQGGGIVSARQGAGAITGAATGASRSRPSVGGGGGGDGRASIGLASQSWSCPWPDEAESLPIAEETAIIRVVVRPDGTAESVAVVSDPGHGFGPAAARCALRARFTPARGPTGELARETSSPIRVRFTR